MDRFVLTEAQWSQIEPHCLGKSTDPGRSGGNNWLFIGAVLWIARTGSRCFQSHIRCPVERTRHGIRHGRCHHRQSSPARPERKRKRGAQSQAIGRSKGGMTTKILALTDALGNLVRFVLVPGHRFDALPGDKAYDANWIVEELNQRGAKVGISQHPGRALKLKIDTEMSKWRHLIENFFCKLKEFKRITMRACKTDQSFSAMIYLAAAIINPK